MALSTEYLERCIVTLETALKGLADHQPDEIAYDIYRAACVKEFELILEQSGRLLRKKIGAWSASNQAAAKLTFKDVFRTAAKHGLLEADECERWLEYRESRNDTAHDYGEGFAESAVRRLPQFVVDARALARRLDERIEG
ncbi:MAG: nucleotidyltransferase [Acidobacteria bacterium]|nr:nucleotidyltransferase [Acidobacteriota bacterium]MXX87076.1 nucleotidyltransferase [Acidobacteriota bacterium]MYE44217.1 nucleotidyltransferase [Acidobacteriota bacterium]